MKHILTLFISLSFALTALAQKNFYDFTVKTIDGQDLPLSTFKGKKVLVVNTASKCGLTPQYKELEELYKKYKDQNFVIVAFPSNNFLEQEPGTNKEIKEFCQKNYGVTFPVMEKIDVKGSNIHPLYQWLTSKELNGKENATVRWNFHKYLIDENGNLVGNVNPKESPFCETIVKWIDGK